MGENTHGPAGRGMQSEQAFLAEAPLLRQLDSRLKAARTLAEWGILRAQQGLYLARTSRLDEGLRIPGEIRSRFSGQEDPEVFFWVWLAEGVLDHYRSGGSRSLPLLMRAHAVATALRRADLAQYAAAWIANAHFLKDDHARTFDWLMQSGLHQAQVPEAACRASMVAAIALQTCLEDGLAAVWFGRVRETARRIGDRASIMASIENRALMRLDRLWLEWCRGAPPSYTVGEIESELLGALQYERITGSEAFLHQGEVARIRLHVLRGELGEARARIGQLKDAGSEENFSTVRASKVLRWWLAVQADADAPELALAPAEAARLVDGLDVDDAASSWALLAQIHARRGDRERQREAQANSDRLHAVYADRIDALRTRLSSCPELRA